jgi:hypothetical protein
LSPTLITILIVAAALALVGGGVAALVFGVVKLPFALIGSALRSLVKPIASLFKSKKDKKGGEKAARKSEVKSKPGVEEVATPVAPMAAAAA